MKQKILKIADELQAMAEAGNDTTLAQYAADLRLHASGYPEDSVSSSETNNNETTQDGIEVPKKTPAP